MLNGIQPNSTLAFSSVRYNQRVRNGQLLHSQDGGIKSCQKPNLCHFVSSLMSFWTKEGHCLGLALNFARRIFLSGSVWMETVLLDGENLSLDTLVELGKGSYKIGLATEAWARVNKSRKVKS